MPNQTVQIPFPGFYMSSFNDTLDAEKSYLVSSIDDEHTIEKIRNLLENIDYTNLYKKVAVDYANWFFEQLESGLKSYGLNYEVQQLTEDEVFLSSPKFYNFENDTIHVTLKDGLLPSPAIMKDNPVLFDGFWDKLRQSVKDNCSSYDGFISLMPTEMDRNLLHGNFSVVHGYHNYLYLLEIAELVIDGRYDAEFLYNLELSFIEDQECNGYFCELIAEFCTSYNEVQDLLNSQSAD